MPAIKIQESCIRAIGIYTCAPKFIVAETKISYLRENPYVTSSHHPCRFQRHFFLCDRYLKLNHPDRLDKPGSSSTVGRPRPRAGMPMPLSNFDLLHLISLCSSILIICPLATFSHNQITRRSREITHRYSSASTTPTSQPSAPLSAVHPRTACSYCSRSRSVPRARY